MNTKTADKKTPVKKEVSKAAQKLIDEKKGALLNLKIAAAENSVLVAKQKKQRLEDKVVKAEDKLAKHQEKILTAEKTLADLKTAEATLQADLTADDEALEIAAARIEETQKTLHELRG